MGFYYGKSEPPEEEQPHGCLDVLLLTRAVFGVLLVPLAALVGSLAAIGLILYLFSRWWVLGVAGLAAAAVVIYLYARWERNHFRGS
jgi:hypothetical protein